MLVKMTCNIEVDSEKDLESLKVIENHVERLLDLESWPEIKSVSNVKLEAKGE